MPSANPYDKSSYGLAEEPAEEATPVAETEHAGESDTRTMPAADADDKLSVLGPSVHFKGDLSADEDLLIQGRVEGSIRHTSRHLTIGSKGKVKANIHANYIKIQGEVRGDLYGSQAVIVETSARVQGNIFAPRVGLKEGAKFKGNIDMDFTEEEIKSQPVKKTPLRKQSSAKESLTDPKVDELLD